MAGRVEHLVRKNFWLVTSPMVAIIAALNAEAVGQLVGNTLAPDGALLSAAAPTTKLAPLSRSTERATSAAPILARNAFDHLTGPLTPSASSEAAAGAGGSAADAVDPWTAAPCEGVSVKVIMASGDPDWSLASLAAGSKSILARRGDTVSARVVKYIGWDRVWLESGGALCQAKLFLPKAAASTQSPAPGPSAAPPPARGAKPVDPAIAKGIQKVSPREFNIDRSVVDRILENQAELMRQARVVPEQQNGRTVGIRLMGVKAESLLGVLGMENGDRLQTINGFDVASPEKALEAYARLRTADKLTINLNRKGQDMNIDYNIK
jgi:general secretion pathway protein C